MRNQRHHPAFRTNRLTLEWRPQALRPYSVLELMIDGRSLIEHCETACGKSWDFVSPFGWTSSEHQLHVAERLLLRRAAELPSGRRELLVCPECADLGCGCISAAIERNAGYYIWNDLGYENNYDATMFRLLPMGSFVFSEVDLLRLLAGHISGLTPSTS